MPASSSKTDGSAGRLPASNLRGLAAAFAVLSLDCLGLLAAGIFLLVRSTGHDATDPRAAAVQGAFALLGALIFAALATGCRPYRPQLAVRTPAVLLEVIMIPVSIGLFQSGRPSIGAPLLLSALVALAGLYYGFRSDDPGGG